MTTYECPDCEGPVTQHPYMEEVWSCGECEWWSSERPRWLDYHVGEVAE